MKNKKNNKKYIIIGADDFSFKTISSTCDAFNISGSIAYNDKKSAIYITNIKYCAGDDTKEYEKIDYLTDIYSTIVLQDKKGLVLMNIVMVRKLN